MDLMVAKAIIIALYSRKTLAPHLSVFCGNGSGFNTEGYSNYTPVTVESFIHMHGLISDQKLTRTSGEWKDHLHQHKHD